MIWWRRITKWYIDKTDISNKSDKWLKRHLGSDFQPNKPKNLNK